MDVTALDAIPCSATGRGAAGGVARRSYRAFCYTCVETSQSKLLHTPLATAQALRCGQHVRQSAAPDEADGLITHRTLIGKACVGLSEIECQAHHCTMYTSALAKN
eukprot:4757587-Prymnesium_polylepis.2